MTPDLTDRMKAHKAELLEILRRDPDAPAIDLVDASQVWQAAQDRLEGPAIPADVMKTLRAADAGRSIAKTFTIFTVTLHKA